MQTLQHTVQAEVGLHARPAGLLVKEARKYQSRITVISGEKSAEATRLMALMALGVRCGAMITVKIEGPDEAECAREIKRFLEEHL